jgi:hypothetical protein
MISLIAGVYLHIRFQRLILHEAGALVFKGSYFSFYKKALTNADLRVNEPVIRIIYQCL